MNIELSGTAMFCQYASIPRMKEEEAEFWDIYYDLFYLVSDVKVLANGEDITKQKGKYLIVDDVVKNQIGLEDHPLPIEFRFVREVDFSAELDLDVDDFDPKKLQLRKSIYELQNIPFAIDALNISYDGKIYQLDYEDEYVDRWGYGEDNTITIENL